MSCSIAISGKSIVSSTEHASPQAYLRMTRLHARTYFPVRVVVEGACMRVGSLLREPPSGLSAAAGVH
jgi:hypothetical protein